MAADAHLRAGTMHICRAGSSRPTHVRTCQIAAKAAPDSNSPRVVAHQGAVHLVAMVQGVPQREELRAEMQGQVSQLRALLQDWSGSGGAQAALDAARGPEGAPGAAATDQRKASITVDTLAAEVRACCPHTRLPCALSRAQPWMHA